ncbi:type 2 glycerol-3-phosphate oxidase [Spiroplasma platyhelix]|uniref:Type 2 glycerol-3-phosphate oxidase n=1 Tax=Spiroplasma platyhelix PALS-1 TaxID=1276218 RepID=A0A846U8P9_9MOLU|nr:type 2 glycerol-3-phosphate oxidase [Spiroplasma platyhelix]MBE4703880.1 putative protein MG039 [Spiroplasma platyhelix PALS-1]NKE38253.1 type 2 glycerol-3-phosphate oxidase [Spiroplasma platyhelix PALS-1]UJB29138.1 glycerol-3-phosphate oxidase [Spiroplasma platyhelix PALS-1]
MTKYDVVVVGAGIIGIAVCDELAKRGFKVVVVEKNPKIAEETTEGNSGIIHGGFDPTPGKLNAKLNLVGRKLYEEKWFKELDFPWQKVDSLVIALSEKEKEAVEKLYYRGIENGLQPSELKILTQKEVRNLEPNINPIVDSALLCTSSYIVDPVLLTYALWNRAKANKAELFLNHQVTKIKESKTDFLVTCKNLDQEVTFTCKKVINAAGHYADEIAKMIKAQDFNLIRRRGQYCILEKTEAQTLKNHVIFLVPTIYGKGVIVAPMPDGHILVGPTAEENIAKADTRLVDFKHLKIIQKLGKKIIPSLNVERISKLTSGSRPICQETDDFVIRYAKHNQNFINIAGIKSPGLTAAPAIALQVADMIDRTRKGEK